MGSGCQHVDDNEDAGPSPETIRTNLYDCSALMIAKSIILTFVNSCSFDAHLHSPLCSYDIKISKAVGLNWMSTNLHSFDETKVDLSRSCCASSGKWTASKQSLWNGSILNQTFDKLNDNFAWTLTNRSLLSSCKTNQFSIRQFIHNCLEFFDFICLRLFHRFLRSLPRCLCTRQL